ncbi:putative casein kinase 1 isoform 2 [Trypanosoma grayi]|uniref:putative casein kinase 1 isoform 2 n=1 Tax=Trypanosoma grayi TaxID=71804 RepID=UPI0004F453D2|nr:putative casein kinase 1 isoform 2 [Trypanosoma grayi]KEG15478.1 putative casein kinase 1 isoform 2 [Trypanosoma grayi]
MPHGQKGSISSLKDVIIDERFRILNRLGGGSFGEVYKGVNVLTGEHVAIKLEVTKSNSRALLEYKIYSYLNECAVVVGIPSAYYGGRVGDYNAIVMDLLGPNLEDLFNVCGRKFGTKTVCMIGIQIIQRLQYMHGMHYIHRDIKPENFVMGMDGNSHTVYVVDMGLAKRYRDPATLQHIPWEEKKALTGTARYVSINTHRGFQQSRRDDMESMTYLLLYFLLGDLPWQGMKLKPDDRQYEHICEKKAASSPEMLTRGFPIQFARILQYARNLQFEETPDYSYCVRQLHEALASLGETCDYQYPWLAKLDPHGTEGQSETDSLDEDVGAHARLSTIGGPRKRTSTNATQCRTLTVDDLNDVPDKSGCMETSSNEAPLTGLFEDYGFDIFF